MENQCALNIGTQGEAINQNIAATVGDSTVVKRHHEKIRQEKGSTKTAHTVLRGQTQPDLVNEENEGGTPQMVPKLNCAQRTKLHRPEAKKALPKLITDKI